MLPRRMIHEAVGHRSIENSPDRYGQPRYGMSIVLLVLLMVLFFGGGGAYYGRRSGWGSSHYGGGLLGLILLVVLVVWLSGNLGGPFIR